MFLETVCLVEQDSLLSGAWRQAVTRSPGLSVSYYLGKYIPEKETTLI